MSDNVLENLRARKIKSKELKGNLLELTKNDPRLINSSDNNHIAYIFEKQESEYCFIRSCFDDDSSAMIGNEFCLNFMKDPKKVDLSYYYFNKNESIVYLYDIKKTFVNIDVILHLYEQWKSSIQDAMYCMSKIDGFSINNDNIHIGVITEENNVEKRNDILREYLNPQEPSSPNNVPSFIKSKYKANKIDLISKAKVLDGFDEGKVTISGVTYKFDVRIFDSDKRHYMYFKNGILTSQSDTDTDEFQIDEKYL